MLAFAAISAARVASLATGRGGLPSSDELPWVAAMLLFLAVAGSFFLRSLGLTTLEAIAVAAVSPVLVVFDAPLGSVGPGVSIAANVTGCLLPLAVAAKVLIERRAPWLEMTLLIALAVAISFFASHVVPSRGVMLQYRIPALVVGAVATAMFFKHPERAGAAAFAAGVVGVFVGADLLHLRELTGDGVAGRVILGGAGLLDGIFLVGVLSAGIAASLSTIIRMATGARARARAPT